VLCDNLPGWTKEHNETLSQCHNKNEVNNGSADVLMKNSNKLALVHGSP
jgi:hypothetical protein